MAFLSANSILLKDLAAYAEKTTQKLKDASCAAARRNRRPILHIPSARVDKEDPVRKIAAEDYIGEGLVAILTSIEPCKSWEYFRDAK